MNQHTDCSDFICKSDASIHALSSKSPIQKLQNILTGGKVHHQSSNFAESYIHIYS